MSYMHVDRPPALFWPLLGLGIVLAADGATALVFRALGPGAESNLSLLYLAAPIAALLVGLPACFHFIVAPHCTTIRQEVLVSVGCSLAAHPVMWLLLPLMAFFALQSGSGLFSLSLFPAVSLYSLIYGGRATTPIGALAGALFLILQRAALLPATLKRRERMNAPHEERTSVCNAREATLSTRSPVSLDRGDV